MSKVFDYLYYKLYRATLVGSLKDIAEFAAMIYFSGLIGINVFVLLLFVRKIGWLPLRLLNSRQVIILMICLFILNYFLFLYDERYKQIITRYKQESETQRKKGNMVVWLYVVISIALIFVVALYKPGL